MRTLACLVPFLALVACSPYSPSLPQNSFLCGSADPKCPDGYTCEDGGGGRMVCVEGNGGVIDAATDASTCNDDSNLEPNNDIMHAFQTGLETTPASHSLPLAGLAICPAGDKDIYSVALTSGNFKTITADATYDAGGAVLQVQILNSGGGPINNGSPMGQNTIHAAAAMLPVGTYYVSVFGPAPGAPLQTNNYKLTITVAP